MIGRQLADKLGLRVGDKLRLETGQQNNAVVNIAAVFELGVRELDARYVYLDLKQAQALLNLPGGVTVIDVTVEDIFSADKIARQIERLTSLKTESWMETNAQLMSALTSQSLSTNMIKVFVAISVAFGIASVLSVSVVQRTREIGIMRATGATQQQILRVFLIQGGFMGLVGAMFGSALAWSFLLLWRGVATNPDGTPMFVIVIEPSLFALACAGATLVGILAAVVPARRAARLDPAVAIHG